MKKLLGTVLVLLLMVGIFAPIAAEAACKISNTSRVVSILVPDTLSSLDSEIYFRSSLTSGYIFFCKTRDDRLINAAIKAMTNQINVEAQGTAGSCPTTGTKRYMGLCDWITLLP